MSKAVTKADSIDRAWAEADAEALEALRDTLRRGGFQDRNAAAKEILARTRPVPKVSTSQVATAAAMGAHAGAAHRDITLAKVAERQLARLTVDPNTTDAVFTPLVRVLTSE